jgi:ribosomal protein S18 acetylase RimI-like enzyme
MNRVFIDNSYENVSFDFNNEKLIFKRVADKKGQQGIVFGLFKIDGITQLGESFCRADKYNGEAWYLDNIEIFSGFKRQGYGSQLLEETCKALWKRELADIVLERPGNSIDNDDFDRKIWYKNHGFEAHPDSSKTWMWRHPPSTT